MRAYHAASTSHPHRIHAASHHITWHPRHTSFALFRSPRALFSSSRCVPCLIVRLRALEHQRPSSLRPGPSCPAWTMSAHQLTSPSAQVLLFRYLILAFKYRHHDYRHHDSSVTVWTPLHCSAPLPPSLVTPTPPSYFCICVSSSSPVVSSSCARFLALGCVRVVAVAARFCPSGDSPSCPVCLVSLSHSVPSSLSLVPSSPSLAYAGPPFRSP